MIESTTDDTSPFLRPQSMSPLFLKPDRCPDGACRAIRYGTRHRHPSHEHGRLDGHILCHEPQIVWTNPRGPCLRGMPISTSSLGFYDCLTAFPLCGNVVRLLEPFTSPSTRPRVRCSTGPYLLPLHGTSAISISNLPSCTETQILSIFPNPNQREPACLTCNRDPPLLLHSVLHPHIQKVQTQQRCASRSFVLLCEGKAESG